MDELESNTVNGSGDTQSDVTASNETGDTSSNESSGDLAESGNEQENAQGTEGADESSQPEFVKDSEGKEFVPKEAFEKRLASLTAQKKKTEELLESIRTNPEARKQFLAEVEKQNISAHEEAPQTSEAAQTSGNTSDPVEAMKPLNTWLSGLNHTPEVQAFYKNYTESLLKTVEASVVAYVNKTLKENLSKEVAPLKKFMGQSTLKEFEKTNPDFNKYKAKTLELSEKRGISIEEAYQLVKFPDLMKELSSLKGGKQIASNTPAASNRQKLQNVPIQKRQSAFNGKANESLNLDQAVSAAIKQHWRK
jgi:hypothetical protein